MNDKAMNKKTPDGLKRIGPLAAAKHVHERGHKDGHKDGLVSVNNYYR